MARLIDYHVNCGARDIHVTADSGDGVKLTVTTTVQDEAPINVSIEVDDDLLHKLDAAQSWLENNWGDPAASEAAALAQATTLLAELSDAVRWLAEQLDTAGNISVDEVRARFGIDSTLADEVNDEAERAADDDRPADPPTEATSTSPAASQRPKRPRPTPGGGG